MRKIDRERVKELTTSPEHTTMVAKVQEKVAELHNLPRLQIFKRKKLKQEIKELHRKLAASIATSQST